MGAKVCEIYGLVVSKIWSILSIVSDDVNQVSLHFAVTGAES